MPYIVTEFADGWHNMLGECFILLFFFLISVDFLSIEQTFHSFGFRHKNGSCSLFLYTLHCKEDRTLLPVFRENPQYKMDLDVLLLRQQSQPHGHPHSAVSAVQSNQSKKGHLTTSTTTTTTPPRKEIRPVGQNEKFPNAVPESDLVCSNWYTELKSVCAHGEVQRLSVSLCLRTVRPPSTRICTSWFLLSGSISLVSSFNGGGDGGEGGENDDDVGEDGKRI